MKIALSLSAMLLAVSPVFAQEGEHSDWYDDFDVATAAAKEQGKDLLVDFTGSDWCSWCIRLHEEVFQFDTFLTPAKEKYILVALDFPREDEAKAKVPNPKRNDELNKKYGVRGYPTILLMTNDGEVFAQTGYQEGGPEAYVAHMDEIASTGRKGLAAAKKFSAEYAAAKDARAQIAVVRAAMEALASSAGQPGSSTLADVVRHGLELDANNNKGLKMEVVKALLAAGEGDADLMATAKAMDPKNENGLFEIVVLAEAQSVNSIEAVKSAVASIIALDAIGGPKDRDVAKELYTNGAFWCQRFMEDMPMAKKLAKKAKLLTPQEDAKVHEMLDGILNG